MKTRHLSTVEGGKNGRRERRQEERRGDERRGDERRGDERRGEEGRGGRRGEERRGGRRPRPKRRAETGRGQEKQVDYFTCSLASAPPRIRQPPLPSKLLWLP
eukprot:767430-Hanusia_phi.AAC.1